jgi:5-methylthioadenosine/S-adenosylhomocysteine deaminase
MKQNLEATMSTEKPEVSRGNYLIKGGAVITVDPALGTFPTADVLVRNGAIAGVGPDLTAEGAEVIDASRMIVMPGLIDSHYHMWSTIGRNFLSDGGFEYYPAKWATAEHYGPEDFYNSVMWAWRSWQTGASRPFTTGRTTTAQPST